LQNRSLLAIHIYIFAKFYAKRLDRSENIPKVLGGDTFFETACTFSMISCTRIVRLQQFAAHLLPSTDVFIFPPHLFHAFTLPWEIVETRDLNMSKN